MVAVAKVLVVNPMGMHARPAGRFVALAQTFDARIRVARKGEEVDGASILSLLMLEAVRGTELEIKATGPEAPAAVEAPVELVEHGFEGMDPYDGRGARG